MCALYASQFLPLYSENHVPAVLYLEREDVRSRLDFSGLPDELDSSILSRDTSISVYVLTFSIPLFFRVIEWVRVIEIETRA